MKLWIDAQFSPTIANWLSKSKGITALPVRDLGMQQASDRGIFLAAREANAVVMTKDRDFLRLLEELGAPPQVLWITCGNTSNTHLKKVLESSWEAASSLLLSGEPLVEISDKTS